MALVFSDRRLSSLKLGRLSKFYNNIPQHRFAVLVSSKLSGPPVSVRTDEVSCFSQVVNIYNNGDVI